MSAPRAAFSIQSGRFTLDNKCCMTLWPAFEGVSSLSSLVWVLFLWLARVEMVLFGCQTTCGVLSSLSHFGGGAVAYGSRSIRDGHLKKCTNTNEGKPPEWLRWGKSHTHTHTHTRTHTHTHTHTCTHIHTHRYTHIHIHTQTYFTEEKVR